jgi:hypothetical protein
MPPRNTSITATYTTTTSNEQTFTTPLSLPTPSTTHAHLAALQPAIRTLQADINEFLTEKMAADKTLAEEDARAEDLYGEEEGDGE